jgi:hypothetical protein
MGPGYGPTLPAGGPVNFDGAAERVRERLRQGGYNGLAVTHVMEFSNHFYVLVQEKDTGIGALELIVERNGFIHSEPGPAMMWITKYGHTAGFGGVMGSGMMGYGYGPGPQGPWSGQPNAQVHLFTLEHARQIAAQFLSRVSPGTTPDQGTSFYGYFTFDVESDGKPFAMLSVNAYTGEVWYHTWHGTFVQEKDF